MKFRGVDGAVVAHDHVWLFEAVGGDISEHPAIFIDSSFHSRILITGLCGNCSPEGMAEGPGIVGIHMLKPWAARIGVCRRQIVEREDVITRLNADFLVPDGNLLRQRSVVKIRDVMAVAYMKNAAIGESHGAGIVWVID